MDEKETNKALKKTIAALEEKLKIAERVIAQVPSHIYWMDKDLVFQGSNQAQAQAAGLNSPRELVGTKVSDYLTPPLFDLINGNNLKALNEEKTVVVEEAGRAEDGSIIKTFLSCKSPLYDEKKKLLGIVGISVDITALKEKEVKMQREKEEVEITLAHIISLMPGHVYWQNKKSVLLGCNKRQAEALGAENIEDIVGKTVYDLLPDEQARKIDEINKDVMQKDKVITVEESATFTDGTEKLFLSQKAPIKNKANKTVGCIGVSFDITDRKQAEIALGQAKEKAETANTLKSEFIANISHDIRTPLHSVIGLSELLQIKDHSQEQEDIIQSLVQSSKTLLTLVEDVLNFAKIEAQLTKNNIKFNLETEINNTIETVSNYANKKQLPISCEYDKNIPQKIINDNTVINRILLNLLSNAIKFTDKGKVEVFATCTKKTKNKCTIEISVKDTGIGIPKDKLAFIFDRFYRVKPAYEGEYKGTGLGLAIVKQLADSIQATFKTESKQGRGSIFTFRFESKIVSKPKIKTPNTVSTLDQNKKRHILLVEDDLITQKYTVTTLNDLNCAVDIAPTGKAALKTAHKHYDIVFMDIGLPDMSGFEVAKRLRKTQTSHTPIVALTAHARDFDLDEETLAVMDDFLQKPANHQNFLDILSKWT